MSDEAQALLGGADRGRGQAARVGGSAADIARKLGIAEQTIYRWKKQYGCVFQMKSATDSIRKLPPIPGEACH